MDGQILSPGWLLRGDFSGGTPDPEERPELCTPVNGIKECPGGHHAQQVSDVEDCATNIGFGLDDHEGNREEQCGQHGGGFFWQWEQLRWWTRECASKFLTVPVGAEGMGEEGRGREGERWIGIKFEVWRSMQVKTVPSWRGSKQICFSMCRAVSTGTLLTKNNGTSNWK